MFNLVKFIIQVANEVKQHLLTPLYRWISQTPLYRWTIDTATRSIEWAVTTFLDSRLYLHICVWREIIKERWLVVWYESPSLVAKIPIIYGILLFWPSQLYVLDLMDLREYKRAQTTFCLALIFSTSLVILSRYISTKPHAYYRELTRFWLWPNVCIYLTLAILFSSIVAMTYYAYQAPLYIRLPIDSKCPPWFIINSIKAYCITCLIGVCGLAGIIIGCHIKVPEFVCDFKPTHVFYCVIAGFAFILLTAHAHYLFVMQAADVIYPEPNTIRSIKNPHTLEQAQETIKVLRLRCRWRLLWAFRIKYLTVLYVFLLLIAAHYIRIDKYKPDNFSLASQCWVALIIYIFLILESRFFNALVFNLEASQIQLAMEWHLEQGYNDWWIREVCRALIWLDL